MSSHSTTNSSLPAAAVTGSINKMKAEVFSDELAVAMGAPAWRSTEATLSAELLLPQPNPLRLYDLVVGSSVIGARRRALGQIEASLAAAVKRSKPLTSALNEIEELDLFVI